MCLSNLIVLVRAEDLDFKGTERPEKINANQAAMRTLEEIRGLACIKMGLCVRSGRCDGYQCASDCGV